MRFISKQNAVSLIKVLCRWAQIYILDCLLSFVPQTPQDAELLAERIVVRLQHANSAVVLTTIKVLLYIMNYMDNRRVTEYLCKKMGPPLGKLVLRSYKDILSKHFPSDSSVFWSRSSVCCLAQHTSHHPTTARRSQERRESLLLQVQRPNLCQIGEVRDHVQVGERGEC